MNTRAKFILTYIGGIVTGVILTFVFAFVVNYHSYSSSPSDDVEMFKTPQQEVKVQSFRVMQVLPDGSALAIVEDADDFSYIGIIVMFLRGPVFYDHQIIEVPSGKRAMQVGSYKYITKQGNVKTVPVVQFLDK